VKITSEMVQMEAPIPDGWHINVSTHEYQLFERGAVLFSCTFEACRRTGKEPEELYGIARGIIPSGVGRDRVLDPIVPKHKNGLEPVTLSR
jgi:hypothetical protein